MENAIEITGLRKSYPDFSLQDVTFSIPKGTIMGFIGENGSGKTTTIKAMLDIVHKSEGTVKFFGTCLNDQENAIRERIGVVFDDTCFHKNLTPRDISRIMENIYQKWDVPLYQEYCQKFHLPQEQKIREFSRGMKMKLSIAVALSHHPDLLILDEATAGLDPVCREEILDLLLGFIQDEEHAVLISTHITSDLDKIADYITFIHQGRIVFSRPKDELRDEMGIAKCTEEEFKAFDSTFIVRYRRHQFGVEALIRDRQIFTMRYSGISVDPVSTESVMLFYSRGTEV